MPGRLSAVGCSQDKRFEPLTPWCMLRKGKVHTVSRRIHPEALSVLAELFLVNGDMCAWLYTGSQVRWRVCLCA